MHIEKTLWKLVYMIFQLIHTIRPLMIFHIFIYPDCCINPDIWEEGFLLLESNIVHSICLTPSTGNNDNIAVLFLTHDRYAIVYDEHMQTRLIIVKDIHRTLI